MGWWAEYILWGLHLPLLKGESNLAPFSYVSMDYSFYSHHLNPFA